MPVTIRSITAVKASTWNAIFTLNGPDSIHVYTGSRSTPLAGSCQKRESAIAKEAPTAAHANPPAVLFPHVRPQKRFKIAAQSGINGIQRNRSEATVENSALTI